MGNATAICTDKTGTLTTNRMTVVESYFAGSRYDVTPPIADLPENLVEVLKLDIAVNSSYTSKLTVVGEDIHIHNPLIRLNPSIHPPTYPPTCLSIPSIL